MYCSAWQRQNLNVDIKQSCKDRISSLPSNLVSCHSVSVSDTASVSDSCLPPATQSLHLYFNLSCQNVLTPNTFSVTSRKGGFRVYCSHYNLIILILSMPAIIERNKRTTTYDLASGDIRVPTCGAKRSLTRLQEQLLLPRMVLMGKPEIFRAVGLYMPTTTTFRISTMRGL